MGGLSKCCPVFVLSEVTNELILALVERRLDTLAAEAESGEKPPTNP